MLFDSSIKVNFEIKVPKIKILWIILKNPFVKLMNITPEVVNPAVVDVTTSRTICGLGVSVVVGVSSDVA